MFWFMEGVCFLPVFLVIWSSSTFIISYIVAVLKHDVDVIFPYISDTGTKPPESGIFGLMTTISAFAALRKIVKEVGLSGHMPLRCKSFYSGSQGILQIFLSREGMATIFARYKYVEKMHETTTSSYSRWNCVAFWFGIISCFGMCFIATFQETLVPWVHDISAVSFFITGVIYIVLQSSISCSMYPYGSSRTVCLIRAVISSISVIAALPMIVCGLMVKSTRLHWEMHDKEYVLHAISAVSEWIVSFGFVIFFFTYIREFKKLSLAVKVEVHN